MLRLALRTNAPVFRPPTLLRSPLLRAFHVTTRTYLEKDLIHRVANPETRIHELKTEIKADTKDLNNDLTFAFTESQKKLAFITEKQLAAYSHDLQMQLAEYSLDLQKQLAEYSLDLQKQLAEYSLNLQKQLSAQRKALFDLYFRGIFFTFLGVTTLMIGSTTIIMPWIESRHLDSEIKKRAAILKERGPWADV